ncbi:MAG: chemoreceptor glutamine deamidase CheD [Gammaproteobacteria bacterium]|nr:chemoreceptor glutamine deamidase CheD [Gammaproteobacteria bacterium]
MNVSGSATKKSVASLPPVLAGFEHINRYWDDMHSQFAAKILPGEYYVTRGTEMVVTVLGSCVSACVRDPISGIGGMNHFMLPVSHDGGGSWDTAGVGASTRYGNYAMERLINDILKNGGKRQNLEIKIFGGGKILANMTDIGDKNISFVRTYLIAEGLRLSASDVGDIYPRKVYYTPATGKVLMKKLRALHNNTIYERETAYMEQIVHKPVEGDVTLF